MHSVLTGDPVLNIKSYNNGFAITIKRTREDIFIKSVSKTNVEDILKNIQNINDEEYCYLMMLKQLGDSIVYPTIHFKKLYVMYQKLNEEINAMKEDDNSNIAELEYKLYNTVHMINSGDYSIMFAMTNLFTFINEKGEVDIDFMRDLQKMPAYISGKITGQQNGFFPYC